MTAMQNIVSVRASSFGSLFDCAYKWEGQHILGMKMPSSPRAHLGTAIHSGTAIYDLAMLEKIEGFTSKDAAESMLHELRNPEYEVNWAAESDLTPKKAEIIALSLLDLYIAKIAPNYTFIDIERKVQPLDIDTGAGVIIRLTGSLDRARVSKCGSGVSIVDVKTGRLAVTAEGLAKTKGHRPQLGTYEILYEQDTGIACDDSEIIGLKTFGTPAAATAKVSNAKQLLLGTDNQKGYIQMAGEIFRSGLFTPNPQSQLCSAKYCPRFNSCIYHD